MMRPIHAGSAPRRSTSMLGHMNIHDDKIHNNMDCIAQKIRRDRIVFYVFVLLLWLNICVATMMYFDDPNNLVRLIGPGLVSFSMVIFIVSTKTRLNHNTRKFKEMA